MATCQPVRARHRAVVRVPRPDRTAWCSLGLVVAFAPVSAAVLLPTAVLARRALGLPLADSYALWAATALLYGLRGVQCALARSLWPIRTPTAAEHERLDPVWTLVLDRAGVTPHRFRIMVVDLPEVNAHSIGRDLVCVTTGALAELGDGELAGVLAHELGHHLRMHTATAAFLVWVLIPLQATALLGGLIATPWLSLARRLGHLESRGRVSTAAALSARRIGLALRSVFSAPALAALAVKNAAARDAEYRVDAFAVEVGLGAELLSALRWFAAAGRPTQPTADQGASSVAPIPAGRGRHALDNRRPTHPPLDRRMALIRARVD